MGCCGSKRQNTEYEVTLKDGTVKRAGSMSEVRVLIAQDTSTGARAATFKAVPRIAK